MAALVNILEQSLVLLAIFETGTVFPSVAKVGISRQEEQPASADDIKARTLKVIQRSLNMFLPYRYEKS